MTHFPERRAFNAISRAFHYALSVAILVARGRLMTFIADESDRFSPPKFSTAQSRRDGEYDATAIIARNV